MEELRHTRYVRNQISDVVRMADPTDVSRPFASTAETGIVAGLMATSFFMPVLVVVVLAVVFGGVYFWRRRQSNAHQPHQPVVSSIAE